MARRGMMYGTGSGLPGLAASPMALARADHHRHGEHPLVFGDPQALALVNPAYRLLVRSRLGVLPHLQVVHVIKPPTGRT
ncbi:MAG TPA: hypothetical protein VFK46_00225 [Candidatus Macondimonas sp.]|nr:hypothetical protein [Candidatus Macondimonas sp.]